MPPEAARIVVSEFMDEAALAPLGPGVLYDPTLVDDRPRLLASLGAAEAVIVRNRTRVDTDLLDAAPRLRAVGRLGVGLDNIDVAACEARGVSVHPATGANALSVAEYVIGAALHLVRGTFEATTEVIGGEWPRGRLGGGGEIAGRTMGLVGYGQIARMVGERARALGMDVIATDPAAPDFAEAREASLEELLAEADVVSLHVPLVADTKHLIDRAALARMRPGAVLINTARGGVVDEGALCAALREGRVAGAALDVFEDEPLGAATAERFRGLPVLLTPHVAGVTAEGNRRVSAVTVENVRRALAG